MLLNTLSLLLAAASSTVALPANSNLFSRYTDVKRSVFEKLDGPPAGWIQDDTLDPLDKEHMVMRLRVHLVHQNMEDFHDLAMKIATPGHELYGSHLSQEVINELIAPKDESKELVTSWLEAAGLSTYSSISARSDSVIIEASISQVEKLLNAKYSTFVHSESGDTVIRTLEYSLPDALKDHVDMVQPTTFFGLRALKSSISGQRDFDASADDTTVTSVTGCGSNITPKCLSNLYSYTTATNYNTGLFGIAGFLEQYPIKTDLATFLKSYATQGNSAQSFTCTLVNGGTCPQTASGYGIEANLDVQYGRAITETIPNTFYSVGGRPPWLGTGSNTNEPYLEFLDYLLALNSSALPNTLSISYGDDEYTVPVDYATNVCNLFAQLGARGVSVLVASGDSGVGDSSSCTLNGKPQFGTSFPASCPWVTTVGGTTGVGPEAGWTDSGGGFSSVFAQPSYQTAAVNKWLTTDTTHAGVTAYFNSSGRAYPDVAAAATSFIIVVEGSATLVDGTSCATPTFAGIVQLLNSDRLTSGKAPLGFLNPWLYSNATSGLTDITTGGNSGCSSISGAGFNAVAGWDPATGLGTPIYSSLLTISKAT